MKALRKFESFSKGNSHRIYQYSLFEIYTQCLYAPVYLRPNNFIANNKIYDVTKPMICRNINSTYDV